MLHRSGWKNMALALYWQSLGKHRGQQCVLCTIPHAA